LKIQLTLLAALYLASSAQGVTFVLGDAYNSDGTSDFANPATGLNGNAGNQIDSVYNADTGAFGNPFFGFGDPGGDFSPIVAGNIIGAGDFRTTLEFDISNIAAAPAGFEYVITSVNLFLELNGTDDINNGSVDVSFYSGLGITTGSLAAITPDTTITVANTATPGAFLPSISLSTSSVDLNNPSPSNFLVTFDVAEDGNGIRLGSGLSTTAFPNVGINGTDNSTVAPRLVIEADLVAVPEPSSLGFLSVLGLMGLGYRKRK